MRRAFSITAARATIPARTSCCLPSRSRTTPRSCCRLCATTVRTSVPRCRRSTATMPTATIPAGMPRWLPTACRYSTKLPCRRSRGSSWPSMARRSRWAMTTRPTPRRRRSPILTSCSATRPGSSEIAMPSPARCRAIWRSARAAATRARLPAVWPTRSAAAFLSASATHRTTLPCCRPQITASAQATATRACAAMTSAMPRRAPRAA